ncbi:hypothetical protein BOX15_Mlig014433g1 [Macrostomum lignano]|uniref:Uncharacterized protein n=2 Tax=Macrostomum lignano TaxID=282301 RepID=A0A267GX06_9PLAT|nr:hypothetical protein BOX15_Mlig014433g1 [Macrostomum lignano]
MEKFLKNYKVAIAKSKVEGLNFFKFGKALYEVGDTKRDSVAHGWPIPPNTTAVAMEISWANATVHCEVILSDEDDLPDVIVTSEELRGFVPTVNYDSVLAEASGPSDYLTLVLTHLLKQINNRAVESVPAGSRLSEQLAGLRAAKEFRDLHWEAFAPAAAAGGTGGLNLQITLPLDYAALSAALLSRYPDEEMCAQLLLRFIDCGLTRRVPAELRLTPSLKNLLQDYQISLKFPDFDANSGSLAAYFTRLLDSLQQRLLGISNSCNRREELINVLLSRHHNALVEYDSENFLWASFIFELNDFHFLLIVELPHEFPHPNQPWILTMRSLYHHRKTGGRAPYEKRFDSPPYSPRWTAGEMADRLEAYVLGAVPQFQRDSVNLLS